MLLGVSAVLLALVARQVDLGQAAALLRRADPRWIALCIPAAFLIYPVRAIRLGLLAWEERLPLADRTAVMTLHGWLAQVLPFRSGELSLVFLLYRYCGIAVGTAARVLAISRFADMAAVGSMILLAAAVTHLPPRSVWVTLGAPSALVGLAGLYAGDFGARALLRVGRTLSARSPHGRSRLAGRILTEAEHLAACYPPGARWHRATLVLLASLVSWWLIFLVFYFVLVSLGLRQPLLVTILGTSGAVVVGALPINTVAAVGTLEAGWAATFVLVGMPRDAAIVSAACSHLLGILLYSLMGVTAWAWLRRRRRLLEPADADTAPVVAAPPRPLQEEFLRAYAPLISEEGRRAKAEKILRVLRRSVPALENCTVLDMGCSAGAITAYLADHVGSIIGIDIDPDALEIARARDSRATFELRRADASGLPSSTFDLVIVNHVYEHVPDARSLVVEARRLLRPGGLCYFAAANRLALIEPHHRLPCLSWLPHPLCDLYLWVFRRKWPYYERLRSCFGIRRLLSGFEISDMTLDMLRWPEDYGLDIAPRARHLLARSWPLPVLLYPVIPTYVYLLRKPG